MNLLRDVSHRLFRLGEQAPWLVLGLVLALQNLLPGPRALWFSDEVRYANVFEELWNHGHWLVLHLNGQFYPDKPPVYFWLLALLRPLFDAPSPRFFFLGAAVSGYLFLLATWTLARAAGAARSVALAAGLILVSVLYFAGLTHYSRMDPLFGALIVFSQAALLRGLTSESASRWTVAGCFLAAVAVLTKGPLGALLPLAAALAWLFWQGRLARLRGRDVRIGLAVLAAVLLAWVGAALALEGRPFIENIFYKQIYRRAFETWHHPQPFYHYLLTLPLAFLPWTLLLLTLPWRPFLAELGGRCGRCLERDFWRGPCPDAGGQAFLWAAVLSGFLLLSAISIKIVVYLVPLFAPLAILAAQRLLALDGRNLARLGLGMGAFFLLLAVGAAGAEFFLPWPVALRGLGVITLLLGAAGLFLLRFAREVDARTLLTAVALTVTLFIQPAALALAPSLDPVMSPREQARAVRDLSDRGYSVLAYNTYSGVYSYYAGMTVPETARLEDVLGLLNREAKVALVMRQKDWDNWEHRPEGLRVAHRQLIVDRYFVVAVKD